MKETSEALARYEEALGLFRAVGDRLGEANVLTAQGTCSPFWMSGRKRWRGMRKRWGCSVRWVIGWAKRTC
ncbi:MAG: hypothetical protein R2932_17510 [Caldilineaceae bacterium]